MASILLIEDDETLRLTIGRALSRSSHDVVGVESIDEARSRFSTMSCDLVITDVHLGEDSGIDFVEELRSQGFDGGIIVMTAYATVDDAVRAMKLGADDYLQKPVRLDELMLLTDRLLERRRESKQLRLYQRLERTRSSMERPIGSSESWIRTLELAERLAKIPVVNRAEDLGSDSGGAVTTVLITGETGAGKGVLARHLHNASAESDRPFVHVNCTALPSTLIESELFGHVKGAFTDAKEAREGLFEMADGGTIFLDEIGDLPLDLQAKLLTVIEQGRIRRVGSTKEHAIRVRVLCATNHDLDQKVKDGAFREDLLYRINAFTITIPALRERKGDALLIAEHLIDRLCREYGIEALDLSDEARRTIGSHPWSGNVRELFNVMQRAVMLCDTGEIGVRDLSLRPDQVADSESGTGPGGAIRFDFVNGPHSADEIEKMLMLQALEHTRGNVSKAARLIGMQRSSFRYRIDRYGLGAAVQEIVSR